VFSQGYNDCSLATGQIAGTARNNEPGAIVAAGQEDNAHHMLSEIYNWFTEGFDTKDLQEAKKLLEALA
jgi:hypothetical protein